MNNATLRILLAAASLCGAAGLARAETVVFACTASNGAVTFTNHQTGDNCEKLLSGPDLAPAADTALKAPVDPVVVAESAPPAQQEAPVATPAVAVAPRATRAPRGPLIQPPAVMQQPRNALETRLAQLRASAIQQTNDAYLSGQQPAGVNRAVNRRYLMISRADYQAANGVTP